MILGIGIDLIEVSRIEKSLNKPAFLKKVFSEKEVELCQQKQSPTQSLAARFAAKEAFMKALGSGWSKGISFCDIEILNNCEGAPYINLLGNTRKQADLLGVQKMSISLSHLQSIASALVILEN